MFELPAWLLAWFYGVTHNYAIAIALIAVVVMLIITPLTLKSTKGMLEMQRLAPEMRRLQQQHRNDRQKLNEEMMKLYQEHKVNPMASCLPLLAQMPVFIIMFRILHGLTYKPTGAAEPLVRAVYVGAGQNPPAELGLHPALHLPHQRPLPEPLRPDRDGVVRPRPGEDAGAGAQRGSRHRPRLRPARRLAGRAVLPAAADGRSPRRGEPDDVARHSRS